MNISHVFSLIIFSFLEDWAIFNFHMKMQLQDGRKKPNTCMINQNTKTPKPSTLQPKMKIPNFPRCFCKHMQIKDFLLMLDSFNDSCKRQQQFVIKQPKI
jgi:hypothetical protein